MILGVCDCDPVRTITRVILASCERHVNHRSFLKLTIDGEIRYPRIHPSNLESLPGSAAGSIIKEPHHDAIFRKEGVHDRSEIRIGSIVENLGVNRTLAKRSDL